MSRSLAVRSGAWGEALGMMAFRVLSPEAVVLIVEHVFEDLARFLFRGR
jgi:hypothetical protein